MKREAEKNKPVGKVKRDGPGLGVDLDAIQAELEGED